jgi:hypothetical protein
MTVDSISAFFNAIKARQDFICDFETLYAKKLAIRFNALDFISWSETKVSQILAFFLDPNAGHSQGDIYLQLFIKEFGLRFNYSDNSKVSVRVEESTDTNRRVDIVLSCKDRMEVLGIENKIYPWTADQKDQVKDYLQYLKNYCTTDCYQLVYIAPKSKILTEYSAGPELSRLKEEEMLVIINYEEDIIKLIGDFISRTENERVKSFLEDFKRRLTEKYIGNENLDSRKMLAKFINENEENLKIAFSIANSLNGVKEQLKMDLSMQMAEVAMELQITYDPQHGHFELPNLKNCYVKYNYEEGGVLYGLVKKPSFYSSHPERISRLDLAVHFGVKFKSSAWWPLYFKKYAEIDTNENLWIDIKNKHFSKFIKDFINQVMQLPSELIQDL